MLSDLVVGAFDAFDALGALFLADLLAAFFFAAIQFAPYVSSSSISNAA
jgi:hypothetical protein